MLMATPIAMSGINAAEKRLSVSANNVANQQTLGGTTLGAVPYQPQQVQQVALPTGGVQTLLKNKEPGTVTVPAPYGSEFGLVEMPNVDTAQELFEQKMATYDYKANLKVIQAEKETSESLLNILS